MRLLLDLFCTFARVGGLTFGGGLTMLPLLKREIVEHKGWTTEPELLDCYAIGQCTPGIIAVNTATFIGYRKAGVLGGIIATLGMVTPSVVIILLVASVLSGFMSVLPVVWALNGIRAAVCALMLNTAITMFKKSVADRLGLLIFLVALLLSTFLNVSSIAIVIAAGLVGVLATRHKEGRS